MSLDDTRSLLEKAKLASGGSTSDNYYSKAQQRQTSQEHQYVPGVGRITRRYSNARLKSPR